MHRERFQPFEADFKWLECFSEDELESLWWQGEPETLGPDELDKVVRSWKYKTFQQWILVVSQLLNNLLESYF